jgi:transcriptional regulator with XRE-family HTH domain
MEMSKGSQIRKRREELGINQTDLAAQCGISKQTLYKYENDIVTNIPSDKIETIASKLHVTPDYIMEWEKGSDDYVIELYRRSDAETKEMVKRLLEYQRRVSK